jgi:prepilin-type processing-associated H-X9-DG protein
MNSYLGKRSYPYTSGYRQFTLMSEIVDPRPAQAFVFLDEREDGINDAWFIVDMTGWNPANPAAYTIVDYPADWHNRAGNLSFADGHVETWRWQDRRTMPRHSSGQLLALNRPSPGNPDVARLQAAASRPVP